MTTVELAGPVTGIRAGYRGGIAVDVDTPHGTQTLRLAGDVAPRIYLGMRATVTVEFSPVVDAILAVAA